MFSILLILTLSGQVISDTTPSPNPVHFTTDWSMRTASIVKDGHSFPFTMTGYMNNYHTGEPSDFFCFDGAFSYNTSSGYGHHDFLNYFVYAEFPTIALLKGDLGKYFYRGGLSFHRNLDLTPREDERFQEERCISQYSVPFDEVKITKLTIELVNCGNLDVILHSRNNDSRDFEAMYFKCGAPVPLNWFHSEEFYSIATTKEISLRVIGSLVRSDITIRFAGYYMVNPSIPITLNITVVQPTAALYYPKDERVCKKHYVDIIYNANKLTTSGGPEICDTTLAPFRYNPLHKYGYITQLTKHGFVVFPDNF